MDRDSRTQHVKWCSWGLASGLRCSDGGYYLATDRNLGIELDSRRIWRVSLLFEMDRCTDFSHHGNSLVASGRNISKRKQSSLQTGKLHGFLAGVAVILGNPKAILFCMGILPGFFDLNDLTTLDIGIILIVSAIIPMSGNITLALLVERVRGLLQSKTSVRRINIISGLLLIGVGTLIPFT